MVANLNFSFQFSYDRTKACILSLYLSHLIPNSCKEERNIIYCLYNTPILVSGSGERGGR